MAEGTIPAKYESRTLGTSTNLLSYNSSSNLFTAPRDGYILVQCWNYDTSSLSLWFSSNLLEVKMTKSARQAFLTYAAKGTKWWVGGSGSDRSALFMPLV